MPGIKIVLVNFYTKHVKEIVCEFLLLFEEWGLDMFKYEEALKIAREFTSEFTQCTEMEDAFIFDNPDILGIGGYLPVVVLKKDGSFIPMTQYVLTHKSQKELRKFKI